MRRFSSLLTSKITKKDQNIYDRHYVQLDSHFENLFIISLVYSIKRELNSETKDSKIDESRKMTSTQTAPKKIDGIGPITREGMPISLRSVSS